MKKENTGLCSECGRLISRYKTKCRPCIYKEGYKPKNAKKIAKKWLVRGNISNNSRESSITQEA